MFVPRIVIDSAIVHVFGVVPSGSMCVRLVGTTGINEIGFMQDDVFVPFSDEGGTVSGDAQVKIDCGYGTILAVRTASAQGTATASGI